MTVPAYASQGAANIAVGTSVSLGKPTGLQVGDLICAFLITNSATPCTITAPSGWSKIVSTGITTSGSMLEVWGKIATSGDVAASSFTFSGSPANAIGGWINRCTGADQSTPISGTQASQVTNSGSTGTFPSVTPGDAGALVTIAGLYSYNATPGGTEWSTGTPSGTTLAGNADTPAYSLAFASAVFIQPTATATGTKTIALNGARNINADFLAVAFAIKPSSAPAATPYAWGAPFG